MDDESSPFRELLCQLTAAYRDGKPLVILSDYDGTLTGYFDHPDLAVLSPRTRSALGKLSALPNVFVGVVSGRALGNLRQMVQLEGLYYAGTTGLEIDLLGSVIEHDRAAELKRWIEPLATRMHKATEAFAGTWLENKPYGFTAHYRHLDPNRKADFQSTFQSIVTQTNIPIKTVDVSLGLEMILDIGWNKGTAIDRILDSISNDAFVFFAGDAANDLEAFETARRRQGVTLAIGHEVEFDTDFRFGSPEALGELLYRLHEELSPS